MTEDKKIFYLGVEGGATKSTAILADGDLKIVAERSGGALNYHSLSKETIKNNLEKLVDPLLGKAGNCKIKGVFGLAGLDSAKDEAFYNALIKQILREDSFFKAVNDSKIALESRCSGTGERIIVIAGTGSNVYGENSAGEYFNTVWWDFMLGDEGSGYYFGLKALQAATRSADGRTAKSELQNLVLQVEDTRTFEDFYPIFYEKLSESESIKSFISSFAPLIDRAIEKGDKEAIRIRDEGAAELALGVYTVAKKLGFDKKEFCLGVIGSQWKMPGLFETFKNEVLKQCPKAWFSESENSGAWGAVLMAKSFDFIKT